MGSRLLFAIMIAFCAAPAADAESFKSWAARGAREERGKNPRAAFSSYSNALSAWKDGDGNTTKAKVLCARAALREEGGDDAGALNDLSAGLALDKKNANCFHRRGALLLKAGKTSPAIGDFYRAVALDIGLAQAYADRARAYENQGEKGFAREDYRRACGLGVKAACAKADALESKPAARSATPAKPKPAAPKASAPAAAKMEPAAIAYRPQFQDCLQALDVCVENGDSFGSCVRAAPNCDEEMVKGCCPAACLQAYQTSTNRDRSEAAAYREHFTPDALCGGILSREILSNEILSNEILDKR